MKKVLHLITEAKDDLCEQIISQMGKEPELEQEVVRLDRGEAGIELKAEPDYAELVEKVFAADAVHVW